MNKLEAVYTVTRQRSDHDQQILTVQSITGIASIKPCVIRHHH